MTRKVVLSLIIGVLFLPFLPLLIWSFAQGWYFPQLLPEQWTVANWQAIFTTSTKVGQGFVQSLAIASLATTLALVVGLPAGRALGLMEFPGKGAIKL
ncbi:MAG: ABC transporter permease, partial [Cyanobacteria bacterium P01_E01_bin.43]